MRQDDKRRDKGEDRGRRSRGGNDRRGTAGGRQEHRERSTRRQPMSMEEIRSATRSQTLLSSAHLVQDLVLTFRPGNEIKEELLRQVALARRRSDNQWLENVAWEAQEEFSIEWIQANIGLIPCRSKKFVDSTACMQDIRKKTDPLLQSRQEDAASRTAGAVGPSVEVEEDDLDRHNREVVADVDRFLMEVEEAAASSPHRRQPTARSPCHAPANRSPAKKTASSSPGRKQTIGSSPIKTHVAARNKSPSVSGPSCSRRSPRMSPAKRRKVADSVKSRSGSSNHYQIDCRQRSPIKLHRERTIDKRSWWRERGKVDSQVQSSGSRPYSKEPKRGKVAVSSTPIGPRDRTQMIRGQAAGSSSSKGRQERTEAKGGKAAGSSSSKGRQERTEAKGGKAAGSSSSKGRQERTEAKGGQAAGSSSLKGRREITEVKRGQAAGSSSSKGHVNKEKSKRGQATSSSSSKPVEIERKRTEGQTSKDKTTTDLKKKRRPQKVDQPCPVPWCQGNYKFPKLHVLENHFPTRLDSLASNEELATVDRVEALRYLTSTFLGDQATIDDLLKWINDQGQATDRPNRVMDEFTQRVVTAVAGALGQDTPRQPSLNPLNSPGCLFHWSVMIMLMRRLTHDQHRQFMSHFSYSVSPTMEAESTSLCNVEDLRVHISPAEEARVVDVIREGEGTEDQYEGEDHMEIDAGSPGSEKKDDDEEDGVYAIDSHFHMDRLCRNLGAPEYDLKSILARCGPHDPKDQVEVRGAVAVFCDPHTYPSVEEVRALKSQRVATVVGLHPLKVREVTQQTLARIQDLTSQAEVVGVGETGLDYRADLHSQRQTLDRILDFVLPRHVLVLHCRADRAKDRSDLLSSLFYQCRGKIPAGTKIHLHCFNGSEEDVKQWTNHFPNVYFGFSRMVDRFSEESRRALKQIPASQLLLETDAPYFEFPGYKDSSPALIGMTAAAVAKVRGQTPEEVMRLTADNAQRVYGI